MRNSDDGSAEAVLCATVAIGSASSQSTQQCGYRFLNQDVPSIPRVAGGAFGFLIFSHGFDGPDLYGASSFFETPPV